MLNLIGLLLIAIPVAGSVNPVVTQSNISTTICKSGWVATIRPPAYYTNRLKAKQMKQWNLSGKSTDYIEDHRISLELGGNPTDPNNLWPQPLQLSHRKDTIENSLHKAVCSGKITLAAAQAKILSWPN